MYISTLKVIPLDSLEELFHYTEDTLPVGTVLSSQQLGDLLSTEVMAWVEMENH